MPRNWKDIGDDEILDYTDANTGQMAQYERILRHRENIGLENVSHALFDLKSTMHKSTERLENSIGDAANLQRRSQRFTGFLTFVIALATIAYTWTTWQSVHVQREANAIQRELLALQSTDTPRSPLEQ